jgi:hypothetical protein
VLPLGEEKFGELLLTALRLHARSNIHTPTTAHTGDVGRQDFKLGQHHGRPSFWLVGETGSDELMMNNRVFRDS